MGLCQPIRTRNSQQSRYRNVKMNRRQSMHAHTSRYSQVIHYTGNEQVETARDRKALWQCDGQSWKQTRMANRRQTVNAAREVREEVNSKRITSRFVSVAVYLNRSAAEIQLCIFLISTTMLVSFAPSLLQWVQMRCWQRRDRGERERERECEKVKTKRQPELWASW